MKKSFIFFIIGVSSSISLYFTYATSNSLTTGGLFGTLAFFVMVLISIAAFVDLVRVLDIYIIGGNVDTNIVKIYSVIKFIFGLFTIFLGVFIVYTLIFDHKKLDLMDIAMMAVIGLYLVVYGVRMIYGTKIFLKDKNKR